MAKSGKEKPWWNIFELNLGFESAVAPSIGCCNGDVASGQMIPRTVSAGADLRTPTVIFDDAILLESIITEKHTASGGATTMPTTARYSEMQSPAETPHSKEQQLMQLQEQYAKISGELRALDARISRKTADLECMPANKRIPMAFEVQTMQNQLEAMRTERNLGETLLEFSF
jgi:hypothetical protein